MTIIKVKGRGAENLGRRNIFINGGMQIDTKRNKYWTWYLVFYFR